MSRKKLFIIIGIVAVVIVAVVSIWVAITNNSQTNGGATVLKSSLSADGYYVDKESEKLAPAAVKAVENFATQNVSESKATRDERLGKYFTSGSPVYDYSLDNIGGYIIKTTAKTTSVVQCEEQEGDQGCLDVMVETTFYTSEDSCNLTQKYWVMLENQGGKYIPNNIGVIND